MEATKIRGMPQPAREVPAVRGDRIRLALVASSEYKESTRTSARERTNHG